MKEEQEFGFPLRTDRTMPGSRRLAREKAMQIISAYEYSGTPWSEQYLYIFNRLFNIDDEEVEANSEGKILSQEEKNCIDGDTPIEWKEDHIMFARKLIEKSIENKEYYNSIIVSHSNNWDLERIALIDRTLIYMAVSELIFFPEIPPKVSINEVIDIAKKYSTDKSSIFINGILEAFIKVLKSEGKLKDKEHLLNS